MTDKTLYDYFIAETNKRFDKIDAQLVCINKKVNELYESRAVMSFKFTLIGLIAGVAIVAVRIFSKMKTQFKKYFKELKDEVKAWAVITSLWLWLSLIQIKAWLGIY